MNFKNYNAYPNETTYTFTESQIITITNTGAYPITYNFDASVSASGNVTLQPGDVSNDPRSCTTLHVISSNGIQSFQVELETEISHQIGNLSDSIGTVVESFSALQTALTTIGTTNATIVIPKPITVTANTTIPSNVHLIVSKSGLITVNSGITLTINGSIGSGAWQIFAGSGTVNGSPAVLFAYAEWFGAVTGSTSTDNAPIIQQALNFFHIVWLSKGVYYLNSTITLPYGCTLQGVGRLAYTGYDDTTIYQQGNVPAFTFASGAGFVTLDNFCIKGNTANTGNHGILFPSYGNYSKISRLYITQCGGDGIHASGSASTGVDMCHFHDVKIELCTGWGVYLGLDSSAGNGFNTSKFELIECTRNQKGGFSLDQCTSLVFERCHSFWNESTTNATTYGYVVQSNNATDLQFINCWSESNGEHSYPDPTHKSGGFVVNGGINITFQTCHTTNEDRGFIINGGTNIIIDNPDIHVQTYASCADIIIFSAATDVKVINYNMPSSAVVANFSTTSWIDTTNDYPSSGRIPTNSRFKRTQKGKAECTSQGTATQYQYNASINAANAGDTFLVWSTSNNLRIGDNILIPGAGSAGGGLNAQITEVDVVNQKLMLSTSIVTAITSSAVPATNYPATHSEIWANTHSDSAVTGYWQIGDIIWYKNPNVYYSIGEICVYAGSVGTWEPFGRVQFQSTGTTSIANNGTIPCMNGALMYTSLTVAPTANITGAILQAGSNSVNGGQEIIIHNNSAYTVTFDVSGTSHVANGTSCVIAANTAAKFSWNQVTSLWYRIQ